VLTRKHRSTAAGIGLGLACGRKRLPRATPRAIPGAGNDGRAHHFGRLVSQTDAALADLYRFAMLEMTEDKAASQQAWRDRHRPRFTGR
jgi:hypothetical protein